MWNNTETRSHVFAYACRFPCLASHFKQRDYFKYPLIQQNNEKFAFNEESAFVMMIEHKVLGRGLRHRSNLFLYCTFSKW